ncbi:PQQ-binding-like beta-propeller repeat protein [Streptomyces achromogenes]|uniref:outer membrane protein assembly factor BamB family protein n=1 Tax=Streptomyces achromogenes TaxID=67255 RepID=UPI0036B6820C
MNQPPDQPPQGGFGAPQDQPPQPGGFGAPQPPPAQGGFGAPPPPQAPPVQGGFGAPQPPAAAPQPPAAPPQPQPGYGYPQPGPYGGTPGPYGGGTPGPYGQPQPGPYGHPQQAPQQPGPYGAPQHGYGQPPQPPYPGMPGAAPGIPGAPSGGPASKKKTALIIGSAVAALLVIGGTVVAVTAGGDDKGGGKKPVAHGSDGPVHSATASPTTAGGADPDHLNDGRGPGEAKVLWYAPPPDAPKSGADAPGLWVAGDTVVKAAYKQVFAFGAGDGHTAWGPVSLPQKICAVTPHKSADDKVVVAYMSGAGEHAKCNQLQQLDLRTGEKGWSGEVADGGLFDSALTIELTVGGRTLMVGRSQSGTAYDIDSGKKLYDKKRYGAACFPAAYAGGTDRIIQVSSCGVGGSDEHEELQELDPANGTVRWTQKLKKGWEVSRTYSVDPLVVYLTNREKKTWNISAITADGKVRSQVAVDGKFAPRCGWAILERDLQGCQGVAVDGDTLYLPTDATVSANEIVAVGLADGKEKWRVKSPGDRPMYPVKTEGGKLIAYVQPSYDSGGQVVSVPTAGSSHTATALLRNPRGAAGVENTFYDGVLDWTGGRLFISAGRLSGDDDSKEKLIMAFGD